MEIREYREVEQALCRTGRDPVVAGQRPGLCKAQARSLHQPLRYQRKYA